MIAKANFKVEIYTIGGALLFSAARLISTEAVHRGLLDCERLRIGRGATVLIGLRGGVESGLSRYSGLLGLAKRLL